MVKEALIHLDNGKTLTIKANNQSEQNVYVQSVSVNGKTLEGSMLLYQDIINGGELIFEMNNLSNKEK